MNKELESKFKMLKAVFYTLSTNSDITSSFAREVSIYEEYISRIREIANRQNSSYINSDYGQTIENDVKDLCKKIASAIRGYAAMSGRSELLTNTSVKEKNIEEKTEIALYRNAQELSDLAVENKTSLSLFGISDKYLNDFENILHRFSKVIGLKSQHQVISSKEDELNNIYQSAVNFLENTIDSLVEQEKKIFPKFYNEYKSARLLNTKETLQSQYYFA